MKTSMWHGNVKITARSGGGGLTWAFGLLALGFLAWLGATVMRALGAAADGVRESAGTANVVLSTLLGAAVLVAVVGGGTWALMRRRQAVRARPLEEAARALVSRDIAVGQLDRARQRRAIAPPYTPHATYSGPRGEKSVRRNHAARLPLGGGRR